jgi:cysteine desulfuration protein SufE
MAHATRSRGMGSTPGARTGGSRTGRKPRQCAAGTDGETGVGGCTEAGVGVRHQEPRLRPTVGKRMTLTENLSAIVRRFQNAPRDLRVQALLYYAKKVPPLPEEFADDRSALEQVHECQTPFFLATRIDGDRRVHLFFDAPAESPTVRGFAGILREGLEGSTPEEVLEVPADFYSSMGLEQVVSPLRLRGMGAILGRLQRQVREQAGEDS